MPQNISLNKNFRRVVQLELNEISDSIVTKLISDGVLPNFKRLQTDWFHYQTTSESEYHLIEPWIQWVSVHTGKTFAEHKIFHLGDQYHLTYPQTWELLSAQGLNTCVVSGLNSQRGQMKTGIFIPDPWAKRDETSPRSLAPIWKLLSKKIQGHATAGKISPRELMAGAWACLKLGLPITLYVRIALDFAQAFARRSQRWILASSLDRLLSEVFLALVKKNRPAFASLFLNSVAHYQHHYWRNHDQSGFNQAVLSPDCAATDDPVTRGYKIFDALIGRIIKQLDDGDTVFIVASGLSQEPYQEHEDEGGMNYYRLKDHAAFATLIGLQNVNVFPLMSRDWRIEYQDSSVIEILKGLNVENKPLFNCDISKPGNIFIETAITSAVSPLATVLRADGSVVGIFAELFANTAVKSGHHTGIGTCWLSAPLCGVNAEENIPIGALHDIALLALARDVRDQATFNSQQAPASI